MALCAGALPDSCSKPAGLAEDFTGVHSRPFDRLRANGFSPFVVNSDSIESLDEAGTVEGPPEPALKVLR